MGGFITIVYYVFTLQKPNCDDMKGIKSPTDMDNEEGTRRFQPISVRQGCVCLGKQLPYAACRSEAHREFWGLGGPGTLSACVEAENGLNGSAIWGL